MTVMLSQEKITYELHDMDTERPCYPYTCPTTGGLIVAKNERGHTVGHLRWYKEGHDREFMIDMVRVETPYQRRGIATRLLREAQKIDPRVRHSSCRTESGDHWAKATGDPIPVRSLWTTRWSASHFYQIVDDVRHIIEHESAWENPAWIKKSSSGATSGSPSPNRKSTTSTVTTPPTKTASSSKKYA